MAAEEDTVGVPRAAEEDTDALKAEDHTEDILKVEIIVQGTTIITVVEDRHTEEGRMEDPAIHVAEKAAEVDLATPVAEKVAEADLATPVVEAAAAAAGVVTLAAGEVRICFKISA